MDETTGCQGNAVSWEAANIAITKLHCAGKTAHFYFRNNFAKPRFIFDSYFIAQKAR